jgi:serine/threonine protein kinase/tetratricopeptide (TPR) repeat protein
MSEVTDRRVGPYRLDKLLGQGGMGAVYQAWDERLERWVAVKQIRPESADNSRVRERFRREARASARLNHPSIVQIFDIIESEDGDWIVMELVEGRTLARVLEDDRPDLQRVLGLAREIAWALAAAHRKSIVHRDLKAENILVTPDGHAKILDFGLAKVVDPERHAATLTIPGGPMGTARSMSPEQARGLELDARSDLFSFGVLLYEAIAGVSPFQGRTVFDTLVRVATHEPPPLSETLPELPGELVGLVASLLQKDPAQRPQNVDEVTAVLDRLLSSGSGEDSGTTALRLLQLPRRSPASSTELLAQTLEESGSGNTPAAPISRSQASTLERPPLGPAAAASGGQPAGRRRLWPAAAAAGALAIAGFFVLRPAAPPKSLYVAVRQPEITGGAGIANSELLATGLRVALLNTLASLEGISALAPEIVDPIAGSPMDVAKASGADEVVTARLSCRAEGCVVELARLRGADGTVAWSSSFQFPLEDFHTLASAGSIQLRAGYRDHSSRDGAASLEVPSEVVREFAAVLRDYRQRQASPEQLVARLAALEEKAPKFVEPALLASEILRLHYTDASRDAGDLARAVEAGRRAVTVAPGDLRAYHRLFDALLEGKNLAEAETVLAEIERREPGQPEALARRAQLLDNQGRGDEALQRLQVAVSQQPSWTMLFRLANLELKRGQVEDAKGHLEETLKLLPGHYDSLSLLAQVEIVYGSPERAAELYQLLVEQSPGVNELGNLGLAQALLGRWEAARESFARALALEPGNPMVLLNLAESEKILGRREAAEGHYRRVLALLPESDKLTAQEWSVRAQALAHLGEVNEAVAAIQRALQLAPENPQTHYEAALVYALAGEKTSALVNARQALKGGIDARFFSSPFFDSLRSELPPAAPAVQ